MREEDLYRPVADFVKKEFQCFAIDSKKGIQYGSIDVVGIRHVMGDLGGDNEVIAVEVKPEESTYAKSLGQAYGYSIMADRCYLAMHKKYNRDFTQEEKDIAAKLNVGLIRIGKGKSCQVVLSSPKHNPIEAYKLALIYKLGYYNCVICGSLFEKKEITCQGEKRSNLLKATREGRQYLYWLARLSEQRNEKRKYEYDRRAICGDCVQIFSDFTSQE